MIQKLMQEQKEAWEKLGSYMPLLSYVLDKGTEYRNVITSKTLGEPKMCYMNAYNYVMDHPDHDYVEGYMLLEDIPLLIEHAWVFNTKSNEAIEVTTPTKAIGYFGVRYNQRSMIKWALKSGYYGIHFKGEMYNTELLKDYINHARKFR